LSISERKDREGGMGWELPRSLPRQKGWGKNGMGGLGQTERKGNVGRSGGGVKGLFLVERTDPGEE